MNISARIAGIKYVPLLCRRLNVFNLSELSEAMSKEATFILKIDDKNQIALSWWVSAKRTRSYPYARVYDTLGFSGKKVTIIPIFKDEGVDGDRDFLQFDTILLMSLLGVYVIIGYYKEAGKNPKYVNKITNQVYDTEYVKSEIKRLLSYQSDALHWNIEQINKAGNIGKKALELYEKISKLTGVKMQSKEYAEKRIGELLKGKEVFMNLSRKLAQKAQLRESMTVQPKEMLTGMKATLTIVNYLGGNYYFTADEAEVNKDELSLIEGKHSEGDKLPSVLDVKDGLLKMILFTNLEDVRIGKETYRPIPILKLTTGKGFDINKLNKAAKQFLDLLKKEAEANRFRVTINNNHL
ncbi:hypothetical protein HYV82_01195 [Candidatus Woesearchaeota archaeon]|nr:hypothetical protein [Candidatus Woesearchaeota archaeon]